MDNFERGLTKESDDRCIPPSKISQDQILELQTESKLFDIQRGKVSSMDSISTEVAPKRTDHCFQGVPDSKSSKENNTGDIEYTLSVENLERIKRGQVISSCDENGLNEESDNYLTPVKRARIASPPLKLEMKTETTLIRDALNHNIREAGKKLSNDIVSDFCEKGVTVKMETLPGNKIDEQKANENSRISNSSTSTPTKSDGSQNKNDKVDSGRKHIR